MDSEIETDPSDYSDLEFIGMTNPAPPSTLQHRGAIPIKTEVTSTAPLLSRSRLMDPPTIKIEQTSSISASALTAVNAMPSLCGDDDYIESEENDIFHKLKIKKEAMNTDSESSYNPFGGESSDDDNDDEDYIPIISKKRKRSSISSAPIKREDAVFCEICGEAFKSWGPHRRHMNNVHDVERPYICYRCPEGPDRKRYVQRSSLEDHWMRDHEGRRDHKCPQCGKGFYTKHEVKGHLKSHENELCIECDLCGQVFHRYIHYRRHMNNVHGVTKPFVCTECPEGTDRPRYASQAGLNKHIERDHLMIRNFKCPHCPKVRFMKRIFP